MAVGRVHAVHEKGGIFQNCFAHHYAANAGFANAFRHIVECADASVRIHRNRELLANHGDGVPVAGSRSIFVLL